MNLDGRPIEPKAFAGHWYRCLRAVGVRVRGLYATKDTYVSLAMSRGVDVAWLQEQAGVAYDTLRRHYGKWMRSHGSDQLRKMVDRPARMDPRMDPRPSATFPNGWRRSTLRSARRGT